MKEFYERAQTYRRNDEVVQAFRDNPDDFPEIVLGPHSIGGSNKGLTIFETDDLKKLLNMSIPFATRLEQKQENTILTRTQGTLVTCMCPTCARNV